MQLHQRGESTHSPPQLLLLVVVVAVAVVEQRKQLGAMQPQALDHQLQVQHRTRLGY
jgi:hypothetical protein